MRTTETGCRGKSGATITYLDVQLGMGANHPKKEEVKITTKAYLSSYIHNRQPSLLEAPWLPTIEVPGLRRESYFLGRLWDVQGYQGFDPHPVGDITRM